MGWYIIRRLLAAIVVLWLVSILAFVGLKLSPGNAFIARMNPEVMATLTPAQIKQGEEALGLNAPLPVQYWRWLTATVHGNLGYSSASSLPVTTELRQHLGNTIVLMLTALIMGLSVAIPLGIIAAAKQGSPFDHVASTVPVVLIGIPSFVVSLALIFFLSVHFSIFPSAGIHTPGDNSLPDLGRHIVLPASVLAIVFGAPILRYTRASMIDVLGSEFIVTARAKGLRRWTVILRHGFRNALLPLITVIGFLLPDVIGGTVIVETIFGWPGMGQLAVTAAGNRDTSVVLGLVLLVAVAVVLSNLLADLAYAWADPRVRIA